MTKMRDILSRRKKWQDKASLRGLSREETAKKILATYLLDDPLYIFDEKPKHLRFFLKGKWGIQPDFSIENTDTGKIAFFEVKSQGAYGNAHERACKYFAPGVERVCAPIAGFERPFFFIFVGEILHSPSHYAQIISWFNAPGYRDRVLMWEDRSIPTLINWFEDVIRGCLQ